jgi:hypothetical protein
LGKSGRKLPGEISENFAPESVKIVKLHFSAKKIGSCGAESRGVIIFIVLPPYCYMYFTSQFTTG